MAISKPIGAGIAALAAVTVLPLAACGPSSSSSSSPAASSSASSSSASSSSSSYTLKSCYQVMPIVGQVTKGLQAASPDYQSLSSEVSSAESIASHDGALNAVTLTGDLATLGIDLATADGGKASGEALKADLAAVNTDCHT